MSAQLFIKKRNGGKTDYFIFYMSDQLFIKKQSFGVVTRVRVKRKQHVFQRKRFADVGCLTIR